MQNRYKWLSALLLSLTLLLGSLPALAASPAHIHFLVVPTTPKAGQSFTQAMNGFRAALLDLTGGYTELGHSRGASLVHGNIKGQENYSFMVAAKADLTDALVVLISNHFQADNPFVLHWVGTWSLK